MRTILPPLLRDVLGAFGGPVVRVAVCGAGNCGKTVFVASLLEHLRNHDPARFDLRGWRVVSAEALAPADGFPEFPLAACRAALCGARPDWRAKTGTASLARFRVALRRGASRRSFVLEMLDLPGERLADVAFMSGRGYGGWCDALGRALFRRGGVGRLLRRGFFLALRGRRPCRVAGVPFPRRFVVFACRVAVVRARRRFWRNAVPALLRAGGRPRGARAHASRPRPGAGS